MEKSQIILTLQDRWVSREELKEMLGTGSDTSVRQWVAALNQELLSHNRCVLSTSTRVGYHIGSYENEDDIAVANLALVELKNKAISIFERRKVIENFLKFSASVEDSKKEIQGTLF